MSKLTIAKRRLIAVVAAAAVLAAGTAVEAKKKKAPPPPPAPAPAPRIVIPARPLAPLGAVPLMQVPPRDATGVRQTVLANLTTAQKSWNLRSALNVAALNCLQPQHAGILPVYKTLLKTHARALTAANRTVAAEFRTRYGAGFASQRDQYMTQVYNYFALPPTLPRFCDAALAVSGELAAVKPGKYDAFAATALPRLDAVFEDFFRAFEQYRADAAAWDAQYLALYRSYYGTNPYGYVEVPPPIVVPTLAMPTTSPQLVVPVAAGVKASPPPLVLPAAAGSAAAPPAAVAPASPTAATSGK